MILNELLLNIFTNLLFLFLIEMALHATSTTKEINIFYDILQISFTNIFKNRPCIVRV